MITSYEDVARLLVENKDRDWYEYGRVYVSHKGNLTIFNYSKGAAVENRWNFFERISRGLIINNVSGEIVARPFLKFFNLGQRDKPKGYIREVTGKEDGSLGILYRHEGLHMVATRGSFDGDQAKWATAFLNARYDLSDLDPRWTLLFEIIYPGNRIVVDYEEREDLVLIGAIDRFTGEDLWFYPDNPEEDNSLWELCHCFGFTEPERFCFNSVNDILEKLEELSHNEEGFVARFSDGTRIKFKGDKYLNAHRVIFNMGYQRVVEACALDTIDDVLARVPDEFHGEVMVMRDEIRAKAKEVMDRVNVAWDVAPRKDSRKKFAVWVQKDCPDLAAYLFARLDNKGDEKIRQMIFKREFN